MIATWLGAWSATYAASPGYVPGDQVGHLSTTWACNVLGTQQEPGIGTDWSKADDLPIVGAPGQAGPPPPPPTPSTANLLVGDTANFDGGTMGLWDPAAGGSVGPIGTWAVSTDQAHSPTYSLKVTQAAAGSPWISLHPGVFPIQRGVEYQAGLWVYTTTPARTVTLTVTWRDLAENLIGKDALIGRYLATDVNEVMGQWAYLTGLWAGSLNPFVAGGDLGFEIDGGQAGDVHYFDDLTFQAVAP